MSADPIVYCLEQLTDYRQFERLCSDLMNGCGFNNIEPMGGSSDGGRDALYSDSCGSQTIFAYTVRSDWRRKLLQDCKRIREEAHTITALVYVCTSSLSATEKDEVRAEIRDSFGWPLDIYDLERMRVLLTGTLRHLVAIHPSIFCPPWFPQRGGLSVSESADTLIIDHVSADHALATWLDRRLSLAGYRTWCYGTAPLAGENADESVRVLIQKRAQQYLPILSTEALADRDFMDRCGLAGDHQVLPCWSEAIESLLPSRLARISPARFANSWATGLRDVESNLKSRGIEPALGSDHGRNIALRAYVPEPVVRATPEPVFANVFRVDVPKSILFYELNQPMSFEVVDKARLAWAFTSTDSQKLFAFEPPPQALGISSQLRPIEFSWEDYGVYNHQRSLDIVKELLRRSLEVACARAGLVWCNDRQVFYFPRTQSGERNVSFVHVDDRRTHVAMTGERQYGWGDRASQFRYQLGPRFKFGRDEEGQWWATVRIYVRVTDLAGACFQLKDITRRRKVVTKSWWNKEWLARLLGLMQALRSVGHEGIQIGDGRRAVTVSVKPLTWLCPISIDVEALERIGDFQEEMSSLRFVAEDDDEDSPSQSEGAIDG